MELFEKIKKTFTGLVPRTKTDKLEDITVDFEKKINSVVVSLLGPYVENGDLKDKRYLELLSLLDPKKCNNIAMTMSSNLNENYTKLELEGYADKIFVGKDMGEKCQDDTCKELNNKKVKGKSKEISKKDLCNSIAVHHIKILNLIAAILTAINPKNNLCVNRLNDLFQLVDIDNSIGISKICDSSIDKNSVINEAGMKELLTLYYFYFIQDIKSPVDKKNFNLQYKKLIYNLEKIVVYPEELEKLNNGENLNNGDKNIKLNNNNNNNNLNDEENNKNTVNTNTEKNNENNNNKIKNIRNNIEELKNKISKIDNKSEEIKMLESQISILTDSIQKYKQNNNNKNNNEEEEPENNNNEEEPENNNNEEELEKNNNNKEEPENNNNNEVVKKYGYQPKQQTGGKNENMNENMDENMNENMNENNTIINQINNAENNTDVSLNNIKPKNNIIKDDLLQNFLDFVSKYQPVKEINKDVITVIKSKFKTVDEKIGFKNFEKFCEKNHDNSINGIKIDIKDKNFEPFLMNFKQMKSFYIETCYKLIDILEDDILKIVNKENIDKMKEDEMKEMPEYKLQNLTYERLFDIESEVRLTVGEMYVKCHQYYLNGVEHLYTALVQ